jgi:hypothetical protein
MKIDRSGRQRKAFEKRAVADHDGSVEPSRGSEQYQPMNFSMACLYARREWTDASMLRTVVSDCSSSGTVFDRLLDLLGSVLTDMGGGSFDRLPMGTHSRAGGQYQVRSHHILKIRKPMRACGRQRTLSCALERADDARPNFVPTAMPLRVRLLLRSPFELRTVNGRRPDDPNGAWY